MNKIVELFKDAVKDKEICLASTTNKKHCGKVGHWLETQFGLKHNGKNEPDIFEFEMKSGEEVTTFIDKAPNEKYLDGQLLKARDKKGKQQYWLQYASKKNSEEATIGGWSIMKYNDAGQIMLLDDNNNISIRYDYTHDKRPNKAELGLELQPPHDIMKWHADALKKAIENKFNQKGWFKCKKEGNAFTKLCFGSPITFDLWISDLKKGNIYHDGYSKLNGRGRHVFRAGNDYWDSLIIAEY